MEAMGERTIAAALAERLGVDPERDPYPVLLAVLASGMFRASLASWSASGGSVPLERLIDLAFQAVADGLPETASLRHALAGVQREQKGKPLMASATPVPAGDRCPGRSGRRRPGLPAAACC